MAGSQDVVAQVDAVLAAAARCSSEQTARTYEALEQLLQDLGELAQLTCEAHIDYAPLIKKLRAGEALSSAEMTTVRLLIVGDADYYLKYDEEFDRGKAEIAKIMGEIERLKAGDLGVEALMHLSVLSREAESLVAPTQHYLEARDRVRNFEASTAGALDRETARTLASIIEGMVARGG